jgi:putative glutathione S-transferase
MTSSGSSTFSLGRESADDGSFRRQESPFRNSWAFTGGEHVDPINGFEFLGEAYAATDPSFDARVTVPVLWDTKTGVIVNNESAEILRMLETVFAPLASHPVDLHPEALRDEIDALNDRIYDNVNNAVYKAGFARRQEVYEREVATLFETLDELDPRLAERRFLFGAEPVETDIRLFTTLVRFDAVYQIHFKCSLRKLIEYEHLWPYTRDLYQWPGIAETVSFDEIRAHYYRTHPMINPSGLVAVQPAASFEDPPGREHLSRLAAPMQQPQQHETAGVGGRAESWRTPGVVRDTDGPGRSRGSSGAGVNAIVPTGPTAAPDYAQARRGSRS